MKHLWIVLLLFAGTASAQTLTKVVNGVTVQLTKTEADAIKAEWQAGKEKASADSIEQVKLDVVRNTVIAAAQTAVGKTATSITATERNAFVLILMNKYGAFDTAGKIRPLNLWAK